ncbi:hypothetical protein G9C98_002487 [Cotesia typhae]|uniref:CID domain-containing protein n=1 Tax=Cotesia typhae TaxID=2053667 RepID=A0A8J5RFW8_9HYME|nr:hypothetical protein G9C98_002487 [Cotesia typhae]
MKLFCHFSEDKLREKLVGLVQTRASTASIEDLYKFIVHHKQKTKLIIDTWASELYKAKPYHKLYFMVLANKIIQEAEKSAPELVLTYKKCLLMVFFYLKNSREDDYLSNGITVILKNWSELRICSDLVDAAKVVFNDLHVSGH